LEEKGIYIAGQEYEPEDLPEEFLNACKLDNSLTEQQRGVRDYFLRIFSDNNFRRKVEDESQENRYKLFSFAVDRIFKNQKSGVVIGKSLAPSIIVEFI
jgi:hypothetical protein